MKHPTKMRASAAVIDAVAELVQLGEELREWADNIEEKFGSTDKYSRLEEAADVLENLSEPSVLLPLEAIEVEIFELPRRKRGPSRPVRRDQAVYMLETVQYALQDILDETVVKSSDTPEHEAWAQELYDEIEELKSEAETVEFPGMFG